MVLSTTGLVLIGRTPHELIPAADEAAPLSGDLLLGIAQLVLAAVGALVAVRRPENPIGWLLCAIAIFNGIYFLASGWARLALMGDPGSLPAGEAFAWLSNLANDTQWPLLILTLLLFPDGRLPSRRWLPLVWLIVLVSAVELLDSAVQPGELEGFSGVVNPNGINAASVLRELDVDLVGNFTLLAAVAALVLKWRRGNAEIRQQLKGVLFAVTLVALAIAVGSVLDAVVPSETLELVINFVITALAAYFAISIGLAVLKYRLYDIDVVINRAAVYAGLTLMLAAAYVACVLLLQLVLSPDSDLAIAASTLAVAALFRPTRSRIQAAVNRRFYRRKYDAVQTVEAFKARLRDQLDIDSLGGELRDVAAESMQPAHVSLWLREVSR